jgi:hypothetical protein
VLAPVHCPVWGGDSSRLAVLLTDIFGVVKLAAAVVQKRIVRMDIMLGWFHCAKAGQKRYRLQKRGIHKAERVLPVLNV